MPSAPSELLFPAWIRSCAATGMLHPGEWGWPSQGRTILPPLPAQVSLVPLQGWLLHSLISCTAGETQSMVITPGSCCRFTGVGMWGLLVLRDFSQAVDFRIVQLLSWEKQRQFTLFPASLTVWSSLTGAVTCSGGSCSMERKGKDHTPQMHLFQQYHNNL